MKDKIYTKNDQTTDGTLTKGEGLLSNNKNKDYVDNKIDKINFLLFGVVVILLVMVATLIIDSFHINSATYKEYSEKIETLNFLRKTNEELIKQNISNQEIILKQQNQILEMLQKK